MFVGRKNELKLLDEAYHSSKSELVVVYGRRRIGKSSLVKNFAKNKAFFYTFEAIEEETTHGQLQHFTELLKKQFNDPILDSVYFKTWEAVLMAAGRSKLISVLKYFWDNHWKDKKVMLILCGSVASFMVKKVILSKALYGRISLEMLLKGLNPNEAYTLFYNKRSKEEILNYLLIFGSVPKYLEEINPGRSFNQNMNRLCFSSQALMVHEVDRIFYSQFREAGIYTLNDISTKLGISSGGGLREYLENLERAEIIKSFIPFDRGLKTKIKKYTLFDEYLIFYFKYIEPNLRTINESSSRKIFETLTKKSFDPWLGFAFERFCIKHSGVLAGIMGFDEEVLLASPYFGKDDHQFQIDLLYKRADKVITICEIKHHKNKIGTKIIPEMERKCSLFALPRGYSLEKALISQYGPDNALRDAKYFNYAVTLDDMFM